MTPQSVPESWTACDNDGAKHSLEIESRADRLADLAQRFSSPTDSRELARSFLQFFKQADVLDGDDRLIGEGFE